MPGSRGGRSAQNESRFSPPRPRPPRGSCPTPPVGTPRRGRALLSPRAAARFFQFRSTLGCVFLLTEKGELAERPAHAAWDVSSPARPHGGPLEPHPPCPAWGPGRAGRSGLRAAEEEEEEEDAFLITAHFKTLQSRNVARRSGLE